MALAAFIALCQAVGIVSSLFTGRALKTWYPSLKKPSFNPPGWVFGPAWITLYCLMGMAGHLIWQQGQSGRDVHLALVLFGIQLFLNGVWSIIFFGMKAPALALLEILLLWLAIAVSMGAFWSISTTATLLFLPYILWVTFAVMLNFKIVQLNRRRK